MSQPKGKYVTIDEQNPDALGICDYSGFVFNKRDLVKQMQWRGNALVWTGFLVGRPFLDVPNEQLRPPILPPDPVPELLPRTPQNIDVFWSNVLTNWEDLTEYTWETWSSIYNGVQCEPTNERAEQLGKVYFGAGS